MSMCTNTRDGSFFYETEQILAKAMVPNLPTLLNPLKKVQMKEKREIKNNF